MFDSAAVKFFRFGRFLGTNGLEIVALPSQYRAASKTFLANFGCERPAKSISIIFFTVFTLARCFSSGIGFGRHEKVISLDFNIEGFHREFGIITPFTVF